MSKPMIEQRRYRAGQEIEDVCRVCKADRMHYVVAADAAGRPLRVACGFCRAEHNYRGGKASSSRSSSGSASGSSAPRKPRAAAEPAEKPKIFKPLNQPPAPSPWAHIFNRDQRPTSTTPTPPATPPRAQAPAAASEPDDSEDDQAGAPRLRRDPSERWGALTASRLQPVEREEVDAEDDYRDREDDEDEDDDLDDFDDAEESAEADARAAARAASAAEAESRRITPSRASDDDEDDASDDEDDDEDDEDEDDEDDRDGGYVLAARSREREDDRQDDRRVTAHAAATDDADDEDADEDEDDEDDDEPVVVRRTLPPPPASAWRVAEERGRVELPRERTMPVQQQADTMPDDLANLEWLIRKVIREETGLTTVSPAPKWRGGQLVLKPGKADLQEKSWPIETFFHKVVMLRNRLRTLEQQVNAMSIPEDEKVKLQAYITGCYGSLTSFNVLFADLDDMFKGSGE